MNATKIRKQATEANPHDWLPVGQGVDLSPNSYAPFTYSADGERIVHCSGRVVEHLANGGVAVKFEGYPNAVDYTAREARKFTCWF